MMMNNLQVLIADLTVEQFCKVLGVCCGFMFIFQVIIFAFFLWLHYEFIKGEKNA